MDKETLNENVVPTTEPMPEARTTTNCPKIKILLRGKEYEVENANPNFVLMLALLNLNDPRVDETFNQFKAELTIDGKKIWPTEDSPSIKNTFKNTLPTLEDLQVLNMWPPGTVGETEDSEMIKTLLDLCQKHGFGRVPQVAAEIEDLWRHPEKRQDYAKRKKSVIKNLLDVTED